MLSPRLRLVALLLPALVAAALATAQDVPAPPPAGGVRELLPELYYMQDDAGRLVPVPGFRYRDFVEMFRLKEGLAGPAMPPAAVLENVTVRIDAGSVTPGAASCPAEVECVVRQSRGGWAPVPLDLRGLVLSEPPRHEGDGRMLVDAAPDGGGYRAWFEPPAAGGNDVRHTVVLVGRVPVEAAERQDSFDLRLPVAIASRVEIGSRRRQPIVVTRPEAAGRIEVAAADEGSAITVTGLAGDVRIRIADPATDVGTAAAAAEAECESTVRIDGRTARIAALLRLANLPGGVDLVSVTLPPQTTLARVGGDATLVGRGGTPEKPTVELAVERTREGSLAIEIDCQRPVDPSGNTRLEPLGFSVGGIDPWRQSGRVSLVVEGEWQASWDDGPGARRIDPPAGERVAGLVASFAYDVQPASMPVTIRPRRSRVLVEPEYRYEVSTARITLTTRLRVAARGAPVGSISIVLPPEWVVDDVGPPSVVEAASLRIDGDRLTVPFVQPLVGDAVVELRAARKIDPAADRVSWKLPTPQADLVGPAAVIVSSDSDIELLPDAEGIAGLVRQTASSVQPGDAERLSLVYRLDAAEGAFTASRRFLARRVEANVAARVSVEEREITVAETLRLNVLYVPLEFLEFTVPETLAVDSFEVRQGDELLEPIEVAAAPEPDATGLPLKRLRAVLPVPLLGAGEVRIRYRIATPEVPPEATVAVDVPLPVPVVTAAGRQSALIEEGPTLAVSVRGDAWRRDLGVQAGVSGRSFASGKPQHVLPLAISPRVGEAASVTVVEAAWLQTRLFPQTREDIASYVVSGPGGPLELRLPPRPSRDEPAAIEVRIDGRSVPGTVRADGTLILDLPDGGDRRLIEIRSSSAWGGTASGLGLPCPLVLEPPAFAADVLERRFYWELLVSADDHVLGRPARWTSQQQWSWQGLGWRRISAVAPADLAGWVATAWGRAEPPPAGLLAVEPALRQNRFMYAGTGRPGEAVVWIVPTWCLVLVASGASLAIGLGLVHRAAWRRPAVVLGLASAAALLRAAAPRGGDARRAGGRARRDDGRRGGGVAVPDGAAGRSAPRHDPFDGQLADPDGSADGLIDRRLAFRIGFRTGHGREGGIMSAAVDMAHGLFRWAVPALLVWPVAVPAEELSFVRVNVPAAAVPDVPREDGRFVPMPLAEFEEAVARLGAERTALRLPLASSARYTLAVDPGGGVAGTLEFTVEPATGLLPAELPLGRVAAGRCTLRTADGTGEAVVFGTRDGGVAVRTAGAGTYSVTLRLPGADPSPRLVLPLVPALVTTVELTLPDSARPFVVGGAAATAVVERMAGSGAWRIVVGPLASLPLILRAEGAAVAPVATWNTVTGRGRRADVTARVLPAGGWNPGRVELVVDQALAIARVWVEEGGDLPWRKADDRLVVELPRSLVGSRRGLLVAAVAPLTAAGPQAVPAVRPAPEQWAGCGTRLLVDSAFAIEDIELEQAVVVAAADAAAWPLPEPEGDLATPAVGMPPPRLFIEHQAAAAVATMLIGERTPVLDTARITTVDISPGTVLGRANADVRVVSGEAFELTAEVAAGWVIDSVETVDRTRPQSPTEPVTGDPSPPEWRVDRLPRGNELRIGLPAAATPGRPLGLRIAGHRAGLPLGAEFSSREMDMVRLPGEAAGGALLEFRVGPTAVVEARGGTLGLEPAFGRLATLVGDSPPRARIRAGERGEVIRARLVRRRPPVDADVRVSLTARDDRLSQAFTFTCRPVSGELDALVVHFSEPLGAGLEWSLVDPAGGTLAARPLASRGDEGGSADAALALGLAGSEEEPSAGGGIAESWLVELRPATTSAVTFRAARTIPLEAAVPVPLAWVEAAERPGGVVSVRGTRGHRPEVVNRRLRELPPAPDGEESALVELAYGPPVGVAAADGGAAADLLPPAGSGGGRAWVWREATRCWCHDSGALEWETMIDLENQGREEVTVSVPAGLTLESVRIDGASVTADSPAGQAGGSVSLAIPARQGRIAVELRGGGNRDDRFGWWTLGAVACGIDVPILERDVSLRLPPGLDAVGVEDASAAGGRWAARLFAARVGSGEAQRVPAIEQGFRDVPVTPLTRGGVTQIVLVRRSLVSSLAISAAVIALAGCFLAARRSGLAAVACCVVAAGAALWCEPPWFAVARAAWWGGLAGTWLAGCRMRPAVALAVLLVAAGTALPEAGGQETSGQKVVSDDGRVPGDAPPAPEPEPVAADDDVGTTAADASGERDSEAISRPLRVFVTPGEGGGTALVPERLFRRLAEAQGQTGLPPVRVMAAAIGVDPAGGPWRIELEIDADRGGSLVLGERGTGVIWQVDAAAAAAGVNVTVGDDPAEIRIQALAAGRHRVSLRCLPAASRQGAVASDTVWLPAAPRGTLRIEAAAGARAPAGVWQCDVATADGPWLRSPADASDAFDVSGASRVRLVRPVDALDRLVAEIRTAVSFNDVDWLPGACRVTATFDVGGERDIIRSVVVRADRGLEPVVAPEVPAVRSLGGGRWLVERPQPRAGTARFTVEFQLPLADPVGAFDVPVVWLERAGTDVRTVRLRPAAGLEAAVDLPLGMALVRPRVEDGPTTTAVWRCDAASGTAEPLLPADPPRPRISVRRKVVKPRGSQELDVLFAEDHTALRLKCQLESAGLPLVELPVEVPPAAVIDGVAFVREEDPAEPAAAGEPMDVVWSRVAPNRILVVVQRPRTGRFRLDVDARLSIRPARRGRVPLARALPDAELPLAVTCRGAPPLSVVLSSEPGPAATAGDRRLVAAGEAPPGYELVRHVGQSPGAEPADVAGEPAREAARAAHEITAVDLAIDRRGRGWGLVRFEVVPPQPVLTIRLPAGLRLFDVRVDGREVAAVPRDGDAWDVRLHDIAWPRTVVAVIAGSTGVRPEDGEPIRLEPPRIDGLEAKRVLWSLVTPPRLAVRVLEPARVLDAGEWSAVVADGRSRQEEAFAASIAMIAERDLERLQTFAAGRLAGERPAGERVWYDAWRSSWSGEPATTRILAASDGGLTIRAVPTDPLSAGGRGVVTLLLVGLALAGWRLASRHPQAWRRLLPRLHRWWWVGSGLAWILLLQPALPGWVLLAVGLWQVTPLPRPPAGPAAREDDSLASDTTRTFIPA